MENCRDESYISSIRVFSEEYRGKLPQNHSWQISSEIRKEKMAKDHSMLDSR